MDDQENRVAPPRGKAPVWVFSLAMFPLCLGGFVLGLGNIVQGYRSLNWTPVPGVVLSSRLEKSFLAPSQPSIRYEYKVNGRSYVSTRLWPGDILAYMPAFNRRATQSILDRFPEGSHVPVYVKSSDPSVGVLIPGPAKAVRWMTIFSLFVFVGLWSPFAISRFSEKVGRGKL